MTAPKRQAIIDGMLEAVGAEGYEAASVQGVLERTGLYRQAFYELFEGKEDCFLAALDTAIERLEALLAAAAAGEETWRGQLRAGLGALLDLLDAQPELGRALLVEVHAAGPEALRRRTEALRRATGFVDLARREGAASDAPPGIAAEGVVSGVNAILHARLSGGAGEGFRKLLPEFMYFAVLPYFGAAAAAEELRAG